MLATDDSMTAVHLAGVAVAIQGRMVLHPLDLAVRRGALTVVSGPNGAGKTTLLETIAGARSPASGTVRCDGVVAFVPQRTAIPDTLPLTVAEVVAMGTWGRRARRNTGNRAAVDAALAALGLTALRRSPFATLSGGQRQRCLLAQALARRADVILLDEPTTGLDDESARRITVAMDTELLRGATIMCVSHDPALRERADDTIRLDDGRMRDPTV